MNKPGIAAEASYFGDHELALRMFRKIGSPYFSWRPIHKETRRITGFKDFVREAGLVDFWRKSGNRGDFCHPVGEDDCECE